MPEYYGLLSNILQLFPVIHRGIVEFETVISACYNDHVGFPDYMRFLLWHNIMWNNHKKHITVCVSYFFFGAVFPIDCSVGICIYDVVGMS